MKTPSAGAPGRAIPLTFVEGAEPEVFACGCGAQPARQRRRSAALRIMARTLSRPDSGSSLRGRDQDREARPLAGGAVQLDRTAVGAGEAAHRREPETGAAPTSVVGEARGARLEPLDLAREFEDAVHLDLGGEGGG